jgi:hypothetical protein
MDRIEDYIEVTKFRPGTNLAQQVVCKKCLEVILDLPKNPTSSELDGEGARFSIHMLLQHEIDLWLGKCENPNCIGCNGVRA